MSDSSASGSAMCPPKKRSRENENDKPTEKPNDSGKKKARITAPDTSEPREPPPEILLGNPPVPVVHQSAEPSPRSAGPSPQLLWIISRRQQWTINQLQLEVSRMKGQQPPQQPQQQQSPSVSASSQQIPQMATPPCPAAFAPVSDAFMRQLARGWYNQQKAIYQLQRDVADLKSQRQQQPYPVSAMTRMATQTGSTTHRQQPSVPVPNNVRVIRTRTSRDVSFTFTFTN